MVNERTTVYLLEDDPSVRRALERLLLAAGFLVKAYASGVEMQHAAVRPPCCFLFDVHLGDMTGPACRQRLAERIPGVRVVYITGHDEDATRGLDDAPGTVVVLRKPVDEQQLLDALRLALA